MFNFFKKPKMTLPQGIEFLSSYLVENAGRTGKMYLNAAAAMNDDLSEEAIFAVMLEFLILDCHLLERQLHQFGKDSFFQEFLQPIRLQSLCRFANGFARAEADMKRYMDTWDSALSAYYKQQDIWRQPLTPGSKQSVAGQFGTRVAALLGAEEFSMEAGLATESVGAMLKGYSQSKLHEKFIKEIRWPNEVA